MTEQTQGDLPIRRDDASRLDLRPGQISAQLAVLSSGSAEHKAALALAHNPEKRELMLAEAGRQWLLYLRSTDLQTRRPMSAEKIQRDFGGLLRSLSESLTSEVLLSHPVIADQVAALIEDQDPDHPLSSSIALISTLAEAAGSHLGDIHPREIALSTGETVFSSLPHAAHECCVSLATLIEPDDGKTPKIVISESEFRRFSLQIQMPLNLRDRIYHSITTSTIAADDFTQELDQFRNTCGSQRDGSLEDWQVPLLKQQLDRLIEKFQSPEEIKAITACLHGIAVFDSQRLRLSEIQFYGRIAQIRFLDSLNRMASSARDTTLQEALIPDLTLAFDNLYTEYPDRLAEIATLTGIPLGYTTHHEKAWTHTGDTDPANLDPSEYRHQD